jgi:peptidoglycan/LPS O-acetylase OafA/YrhL
VTVGFLTTFWMSTLDWYPPEGHAALVRGVYGFFLGALIYRLFDALRARKVSLPGWLEWLAPVLLAATVLFKHSQIPVVPPLLFGALVLIFAAQAGPLSRALKQRVLSYLGEISYSIYLVHYVLVLVAFGAASVLEAVLGVDALTERGPFNAAVINMPNAWVGDFAALAFLGLTIAVAGVTYHWVENPGRRWFNDLSKKVPAT